MPSLLETILQQQRQALILQEEDAERQILLEYELASYGIRTQLQQLLTRAFQQVKPVTANWLYQVGRFESILTQVQGQMRRFANDAEDIARVAQQAAMNTAVSDAADLLKSAMGPVPDSFVFPPSFMATNPRVVEEFLARTSENSPLSRLLQQLPGEAVTAIREAVVPGIAQGKGLNAIGRDISSALEIPKRRAVTIARTEILGSYRDATLERFKQSPEVTQEWVWLSGRDLRTCPVCLALDGRIFPTDQRMGTHPNCRCTLVPRPKSWQEMGIDLPDRRPKRDTGEEWFAKLSHMEQSEVLGKGKLAMYHAGELQLTGVVGYKVDETWGEIRWERSLTDIREGKNIPTERALGRTPN
jgi:SPP1 gp7 family putative phage head morphogenesis protein